MQGDTDTRWYGLGNVVDIVRLNDVDFREYQFNITRNVFKGKNTLVVLPTGLGKTLIGIFAIANALKDKKRALFLSPTKPLSEQHHTTFQKQLNVESSKILLLTGAINRTKRKQLEEEAEVIVATPQTIANDLKNGNMSLNDFGVVVFDECHRAVGRYAYTYIANECDVKGVQMLGLTASPGSNREKIKQLLETLKISEIEVRISVDPDVMQYVMPKYLHVVQVNKSDTIKGMANLLKPMIEESLRKLNNLGLTQFKHFENMPKGRLIELGNEINRIKARNFKFGALYLYIRLLNLMHAYDLLETEGLYAFSQYIDSLRNREKKGRAVESVLNNNNVIVAKRLADEAIGRGEEHPKVFSLIDILRANSGKSTIVFAQYRSTIKMIVDVLTKNGINARAFVGKREGVTQEQQKQTIADFRARKFDVLVSSSIGEEGLDIPSVDLVVFYEPIPSEIRNIQRRGRTGRLYAGEVYLLVTIDTKDQVYLFVSRERERRMLSIINRLRSELTLEDRHDPNQKLLSL